MNKRHILYSLNVEDVINIDIAFSKNNIQFIQEKINNYMEFCWTEPLEYVLSELNKERKKNGFTATFNKRDRKGSKS